MKTDVRDIGIDIDSIHQTRKHQSTTNDLIYSISTELGSRQSTNSPARSIRRVLSDDMNDDFIKVTYKKKRNSNGGGNSNKNHHTTTSNNIGVEPTNSPQAAENVTNQEAISSAATRYAQSRYPFPPFVIRFPFRNVKDKHVAEEICAYFKHQHRSELALINYRLSTTKCTGCEQDMLIYVKDVESFLNLFDQIKWPITLSNSAYTFPSVPSIPPQLSLVMKNVDLRTNMSELSDRIKLQYPDVKNVIRLKNKHQQDIRFVKLELISSQVRNELLKKGKINIDYRSYDIEEYLAPASVLICSKCCGIGHFKRQCSQVSTTCKVCGQKYTDDKAHSCSNVLKCIHCDGAHASNASCCPIVKQFRADLTKKLLHTNHTPVQINKPFNFDPNQFPTLNLPQSSSIVGSNSNILTKLDSLMLNISQVKDKINDLTTWHEKFEKFMDEKNKSDESTRQDISTIMNMNKISESNLIQQDLKLKRHENILSKIVMPLLDEIAKLISTINYDRHGRVVDPDTKILMEIFRAKLKATSDGKDQ